MVITAKVGDSLKNVTLSGSFKKQNSMIQFLYVNRGSEGVFYEKTVIQGFLAVNHHGQCSIVAHSESYNEQFRFSEATELCREFVTKNFDNWPSLYDEGEKGYEESLHDDNSCSDFKKTFYWESNRRTLASAIWLNIALEEAIDRESLQSKFFGPKQNSERTRESFETSLKLYIDKINEKR